jgi:2-methylisocitrate lyase-like PEP mutase family enzyme
MTQARPSVADKRRTFHQMHESGCFAIPNPWDIGSALYLQNMGFKALASTSSGFAWTLGHADNQVSRGQVLAHLEYMVAATDVPINADFESGFAQDADGVAESVRLAVEAGVAGLSIEDSTGDPAHPLYDLDTAVERMRAARRAIDKAGRRHAARRPRRVLPRRSPRPRRNHQAVEGLCERRRRLPLRARTEDP